MSMGIPEGEDREHRDTTVLTDDDGEKRAGYRVFDVIRLTDHETPLTWSAEQLSGWRESGGQPFVTEDALMAFTREHGLETTPRILEQDGAAMPKAPSAEKQEGGGVSVHRRLHPSHAFSCDAARRYSCGLSRMRSGCTPNLPACSVPIASGVPASGRPGPP
ncbi:hypothetical protein [Corallococcus sp. M7]